MNGRHITEVSNALISLPRREDGFWIIGWYDEGYNNSKMFIPYHRIKDIDRVVSENRVIVVYFKDGSVDGADELKDGVEILFETLRLDKPTDTTHRQELVRQELVREADNMPVEDEGDWDVGPLNVVDPRERHGSLDRSGDDET